MDGHIVDIFYDGVFISGKGCTEKSYIGGKKVHFKVNIDKIQSCDAVIEGIKSILKDRMGNKEVVQIHFRKPNMSLAYRLQLLYEGSLQKFIEILQKRQRIQLYIEHNTIPLKKIGPR